MGEREKGHEMRHAITCNSNIGMGTLPCNCTPVEFPVAAHPSAGQSDASLQQECREFVKKHAQDASNKSFYTDNADFFASLAGYLEIFIRTRLAESRAAMREECAKVVSEWRKTHFDISNKEDCIYEICADALEEAMEKFPADSSAIDARDARVRLPYEAVVTEILRVNKYPMRYSITQDPAWKVLVEMANVAQRSAEKGKTEVRYECGCPPRFRVDPKEGKQYEAYCSQHHKPLRRSAEKGRGQ